MSELRPDIDTVLDACIDEIVAGRSTPEQCLEAWPDHAPLLRELLPTVLAMRALPRPEQIAPNPARRQEFLTAIRTLPQETAPAPGHSRLRAVLTAPGRALRWLRPGALLPGSLLSGALSGPLGRGLVAAPAVAIIALVAVLVLQGGGQTAHAATATLFGPGVEQFTGGRWVPLADGDALDAGAHVRAGEDGRAVLTFQDGSTITVEPGGELRLTAADFDGPRAIEIEQLAGALWNDVAPRADPGSSYRVVTADAVAVAHGTTFRTEIAGDVTTVQTATGLVELRTTDRSLQIAAGERAQAARQRLLTERATPVDAQRALRLDVEGPFVASLVAPTGESTGARPDGAVFQQIPGAVTTSPEAGPQHIELQEPGDGEYTLVLRRADAGDGVVVVEVNGQQRRIPLDRLGPDQQVRLRVAVRDGTVQVLRQATVSDAATPERVVITDQARTRADAVADELRERLADQRREREERLRDGQRTRPDRDATPRTDGDGDTGAEDAPSGRSDGRPDAIGPRDARSPDDARPRNDITDGAEDAPTRPNAVAPDDPRPTDDRPDDRLRPAPRPLPTRPADRLRPADSGVEGDAPNADGSDRDSANADGADSDGVRSDGASSGRTASPIAPERIDPRAPSDWEPACEERPDRDRRLPRTRTRCRACEDIRRTDPAVPDWRRWDPTAE